MPATDAGGFEAGDARDAVAEEAGGCPEDSPCWLISKSDVASTGVCCNKVCIQGSCCTSAACASAKGKGYACQDRACVDVASTLSGLRLEVPCEGILDGGLLCKATDPPAQKAALFGTLGRRYRVSLWFRGVVERMSYAGGTNQSAYWLEGGTAEDENGSVFSLETYNPPRTYRLNADPSTEGDAHSGHKADPRCWTIGYIQTIEVEGESTIALSATVGAGDQAMNRDDKGAPIVVPGVPPDPASYNGQFLQVDVLEAIAVEPESDD